MGEILFTSMHCGILPIVVSDAILRRFENSIEKLCDKFTEIGQATGKKLAYIFRIYKE